MSKVRKFRKPHTVFDGPLKIGEYNDFKQPPATMQYKYRWSNNTANDNWTEIYDKNDVIKMNKLNGLGEDNDNYVEIERTMDRSDISNNNLVKTFKSMFACSVSVNGALLEDKHYVTAPCPPYCSGGVIPDEDNLKNGD